MSNIINCIITHTFREWIICDCSLCIICLWNTKLRQLNHADLFVVFIIMQKWMKNLSGEKFWEILILNSGMKTVTVMN
jgi:hypothetical protein